MKRSLLQQNLSKTEEVFPQIFFLSVASKEKTDVIDIKTNLQVYIELLEEGGSKDRAKETTFEMNTNTVNFEMNGDSLI